MSYSVSTFVYCDLMRLESEVEREGMCCSGGVCGLGSIGWGGGG